MKVFDENKVMDGYPPLKPRLQAIDPVIRLNVLREWLYKKIEKGRDWPITFPWYFLGKYPELIPGTKQWCREKATHCFYCDTKLYKNDARRFASIDHWVPRNLKLKDRFNRYVIVCSMCNQYKKNMSPETFMSKINKAYMKGSRLFDYDLKMVKNAMARTQQIANDVLFNTGPKVYYVRK